MIFAEDVNGIQRIERNTLIMNNDEKEINLENSSNPVFKEDVNYLISILKKLVSKNFFYSYTILL